MRQTLVAGNWKMNGSRESIQELMEGIKSGLQDIKKTKIAVCPPFIYVNDVQDLLKGTNIQLGVQNVSHHDGGAFTGEICISMLKDFDCRYIIVGHSERRTIFTEDDDVVAKKFSACLEGGFIPILCVGELLNERENEQTEAVVARQIDAVLNEVGIEGFSNAVVAYEPVWAIGTGRTATPDQAQAVHKFIRQRLCERNAQIGDNIQILYGGSVKGSNARELFSMEDIDGGLIGGASLQAKDFLEICSAKEI